MRSALLLLSLLLPVAALAQEAEPPAPLPDALVVILHTAEFPDGQKLAMDVVAVVIDALGEGDLLGVLVYGPEGVEWAVPLALVTAAPEGEVREQALHPGDMPDFDSVFRMAEAELAKVKASKQILVISDGDPSPPAPGILRQLKAGHVIVSTISYMSHGGADDPSRETLRRIANMTGGKHDHAEGAEQVLEKARRCAARGNEPDTPETERD